MKIKVESLDWLQEETAELVGVTRKGVCKIKKPQGMRERLKNGKIEQGK